MVLHRDQEQDLISTFVCSKLVGRKTILSSVLKVFPLFCQNMSIYETYSYSHYECSSYIERDRYHQFGGCFYPYITWFETDAFLWNPWDTNSEYLVSISFMNYVRRCGIPVKGCPVLIWQLKLMLHHTYVTSNYFNRSFRNQWRYVNLSKA